MSSSGSSSNINKYPETITLSSSDNQEFTLSQSAYTLSTTIKNMIENDGAAKNITFPLIDGKTLEKVAAFLDRHATGYVSCFDKKEFYDSFFADVSIQEAADILMAAQYLDVEDLFDLTGRKIAHVIKDKSMEWVREAFGVKSDFTPEEEEKIERMQAWAYEDVSDDCDDLLECAMVF